VREYPGDAIEKRDDPAVVRYAARPSRRGTRVLVLCVVGLLVGMLPLLAYRSIPRIHSGRDTSPGGQCRFNLRMIGNGLEVYALGNCDTYPPALRALIDDDTLIPQQLVSPLSGHTQPTCDYYYVTGLTPNDPETWIVAYADPAYTNGEGANVLYLDGHVDFVKEPQFSQDLARFKADYQKARGAPPVIIPPN